MILEQDYSITEKWEVERLKEFYESIDIEYDSIPTPCEYSSQPSHEDHESLGSFHRRALSDVLHFPKG